MEKKTEYLKEDVPIFGLVLAGGLSQRMGRDKSLLCYHGIPQSHYLYNLLEPFVDAFFLSVRKEPTQPLPPHLPVIIDEPPHIGPFTGILSAHHFHPHAAWLVVAIDLPFLQSDTLQFLIQSRAPEKEATVFYTRTPPHLEPLCAIWEPSGLRKAKEQVKTHNIRSPLSFLKSVEVEQVIPFRETDFFNANKEEDYLTALQILSKSNLS